MPRGDRTGPGGMGPRTGRAAGYCAGFGLPGYVNPGPGMGLGMGWGWRGGGRGWRHMYYATGLPGWMRSGYAWPWAAPPTYASPAYAPPEPDPQQERDALKAQAEWLQEQLDGISRRMSELESKEE